MGLIKGPLTMRLGLPWNPTSSPASQVREIPEPASLAVVWVSGQDRDDAVELFQKHDPYQLVRPGGGAEREAQIGALGQIRRQAVGTADDEDRSLPAVIAPL